jgi:hypothetical protein
MSVSVAEYTSNTPRDPIPVLRRCDYWRYVDVAAANGWPVLPPRVLPFPCWPIVELVPFVGPSQRIRSGWHFAYASLANPGDSDVSVYVVFGDIPVDFRMHRGSTAVVSFFSLGAVSRVLISTTDTASVANVGN